jgi:hypothetical protein
LVLKKRLTHRFFEVRVVRAAIAMSKMKKNAKNNTFTKQKTSYPTTAKARFYYFEGSVA